jgi:hypothetical protein
MKTAELNNDGRCLLLIKNKRTFTIRIMSSGNISMIIGSATLILQRHLTEYLSDFIVSVMHRNCYSMRHLYRIILFRSEIPASSQHSLVKIFITDVRF